MIPYTELTEEVIGNLEIDSNDMDRYKVVENLNAAQLELLNTLPTKFISNIVKTTAVDLSINVVSYQWPNDFLRYLQLWLDFTAAITVDNRGREATTFIAGNYLRPMMDIASTQFPFIDVEIEGGYEIRPKPSATMVHGGRMRYVYRPQAIATNQPSLLNYNLRNLLVYKGTQLSALIDEYRPDLSDRFGGFFDKELMKFMPKKEKP